MPRKKLTQEEVEKRFKEKNLELIDNYLGSNIKVLTKCLKCGYEWKIKPSNVFSGYGCPNCAKNKKLSQKEVEKRFLERNFKLLSNYINAHQKVLVQCLKCEYSWKVYPYSIFNGSSCPNCYGNRKLTLEEIKKILSNKGLELLSEYKNIDSKIKVRCLKCNYEWETTLYNIKKGKGCIKCNRKVKLTQEEVEKRFKEKGYELLSNYVNNRTKVKARCLKCNNIWKVRPYDIFNNHGCPKCYLRTPKWEIEIINLLKRKELKNIIHNYKLDNRKEIDIYLPDYKLGIELNGLYWHSYGPNIKNSFNTKNKVKYHLYEKKLLGLEKGIDIIFIFEHEYLDKHKFNKIFNFILAKLGLFKEKIYARKCQFKEIDHINAFKFYDKYHIRGIPPHGKHFGLIHNNEIVSMVSFRKEKNEIILTRYCQKNGFQVIGGFQKLLKNSVKYFDNNLPIVTFIDLRFVNPHNNVFVRNGFIKVGDVEPRYFYWRWLGDGYEILERRNAQRKNLEKIILNFDPRLTEEENVFQEFDGKCYDAGKIKLKLAPGSQSQGH